jgi:hypothetical protein
LNTKQLKTRVIRLFCSLTNLRPPTEGRPFEWAEVLPALEEDGVLGRHPWALEGLPPRGRGAQRATAGRPRPAVLCNQK